jgi:lipoate-protein ligase B
MSFCYLVRYRIFPRGTERNAYNIRLVEHSPTYTTGRRDSRSDSLHPEEQKVQNVGAEFHVTKRGGQVTYHGPGQLVGYPLIDLQRSEVSLAVRLSLPNHDRIDQATMQVSTRCYVSYLQDILAAYAREKHGLQVLAPHPDDHVGVFANAQEKVSQTDPVIADSWLTPI